MSRWRFFLTVLVLDGDIIILCLGLLAILMASSLLASTKSRPAMGIVVLLQQLMYMDGVLIEVNLVQCLIFVFDGRKDKDNILKRFCSGCRLQRKSHMPERLS